MKITALLLLLFAAIPFSAADKEVAVPLSQEPHHHVILQNQETRVWELALAPHQSTLMHRHDHDYLAVILTPSEIQNVIEGKQPTTGHAGVGEVRFTTAPTAHRIVNMADGPHRSLVVEILNKKAGQHGEGERGLDIGHGGLSDIVVDNSEVRVQEVQIAPGGMLHKHTHKYPFLVVALSDLDLHNMPQGKPAATVHRKAGEVIWASSGTTHEVMNVGKQEAHFIEIEFK